MSIIKASEAAFCRIQLPDLEKAHQFLVDFGLIPVSDDGNRRFYRGTDALPYCYSVEEGPERFLGFALLAKSREDLDTLRSATGRPIEPNEGPGGGVRVRLQEPNGYDVDIVHGMDLAEPIAVARQAYNTVAQPTLRANELYRLNKGAPTPVRRLAHVVLGTPVVDETIGWFKDTLGFLSSDDIVVGPEKKMFGSFLRVDEGDKHVDHHTAFIIQSPSAGLHHLSFEVQDIDAVLHDNHHLKSLNRYEHVWGIGRHLLGSQVYDYWADPYGYIHEHWADSDRLSAEIPADVWEPQTGMVSQWGEPTPQRMREGVKA